VTSLGGGILRKGGSTMLEKLIDNPFILIIILFALFSGIQTIAYYWWKVNADKLEFTLKQEMIRKGMSADEMMKILSIRSRAKQGSARMRSAGKEEPTTPATAKQAPHATPDRHENQFEARGER
jgi:hypothetical protein